MTYEVGDKVRILHTDWPELYPIDSVWKVIEAASNYVWLRPRHASSALGLFYNEEIEFVSKECPSPAADMKPSNPKDIIGSDKIPLHLWPALASAQGALALLDGALKYGRSNFRSVGVRSSIYADAAMRHIIAWFEGEDFDKDSGLPNLGHALACLAIIIDAEAAGKLTDDRMFPGGYREAFDKLTPHVKRVREMHKDRTPPTHYTKASADADVS